VVGIADNGDFERLMGDFGIEYPSGKIDDYLFSYFNRLYRISAQNPVSSVYISSEKLFIAAGVWLNALHRRDGMFDIRSLGFLHALCYWLLGTGILFLLTCNSWPSQLLLSA
jgi:hypothetical protein